MKLLNKLQSTMLQAGFKKYLYNTGWMFAEKFLRLIGGLFVGAYVARYLGPGGYGLLNYAISMVVMFMTLANLGFDQILVRELVRNDQTTGINKLVGTAFFSKLLAVTIIAVLFVSVIALTNSWESGLIMCAIIIGYFFDSFSVIDYFFQSQVMSRYAVWSQIIALIVVSLTRVTLVLIKAPLVWLALTYALDYFMIALGLIFFYSKQHGSVFRWKFNKDTAQGLLRHSWPVMMAAIAVGIYMRIDQIMIKWMLGDAANGNYGVAVRLTEIWYFIPVAIGASLFPAILNAKAQSEALYLSRLQKLYDLMVALSVTIAVITSFIGPWVVTFLFGSDYAEAGTILTIYIWGGVFVFLNVANGKWIISENLQLFQMYTLILSSVLNIILNFILIPTVGVTGAAISTLIAYIFAGYLSYGLTRRTRKMFVFCSRSLNIPGLIKRMMAYVSKKEDHSF